MVFLNHFLKKNDFERNQQTIKKHEKLPRGGGGGGGGGGGQRVKNSYL